MQIPNDELSWEKSKNFNVGIDFGIFGCLNGSIEYYNKLQMPYYLKNHWRPQPDLKMLYQT
nr:TonB-dependent receptor [Phocaeicola vulgatus]